MPAAIDSANPLGYELDILTIINNEGDGFDIREIFIECNIYESIHRNFLLGEVVVTDQIGFLENAKLFGQESIRIKFNQPSGKQDALDESNAIDQLFRIYKVDAITRVKGSLQAFKISFCSPEMLTSKRKRISQAFNGSMTDIAALVANDHLGISNSDLDTPYFGVREKSKGDKYHVVIPNWTVGYAINWLCKQAQGVDSESGLQDSFYWFQTASSGYRIQSLNTMFKLEYGDGRPFYYIEGSTADGQNLPYDMTGEDGQIGMGRRILAYKVETHANVLQGVTDGLFSSKQTTIDNTYKIYTEKTYNFLEKHFGGKGQSLNPHPIVRTQPEKLHTGSNSSNGGDVTTGVIEVGEGIGDYPDAYQILTSDSSFVNDDNDNIHQANHFTHLGASQFRNSANQLLKYYRMNVVISARTDVMCGTLINLSIPSVRPGEGSVEPKFDGGQHLITDIKWTLTKDELTTNLTVIKDSLINNIETTKMDYGETVTV